MGKKDLKTFRLFSKKNQIFYCYGTSSNKPLSYRNYFELGSCCDMTKKKALNRARGEHIERKTIFRIPNKTIAFRKQSFHELQKKKLPAIHPAIFSPFSSQQLIHSPYKNFNISGKNKISWIKGWELISKREVILPLSLFSMKSKDRIYPMDTTGSASHTDSEQALLNSIYEVVERDAIATSFFQEFSCEQIDITQIDGKETQKIITILRSHDIQCIVLDITSDIKIPTFLCVLHMMFDNKMIFALGASTRFEEVKAINKSLLEAYHTLGVLIETLEASKKNDRLGPLYSEFTPITKRLWWWIEHQNIAKDFIAELSGIKSRPLKMITKKDILDDTIEHLRKKNITQIFTSELNKNIKKDSHYVYKTLIPQLALLPLNSNYEYLYQRRLVGALTPDKKNVKKVLIKHQLPEHFLLSHHPFP